VVLQITTSTDAGARASIERAASVLGDGAPAGGPLEWEIAEEGSWIAFDRPGDPLAVQLAAGAFSPAVVAAIGAHLATSLGALDQAGLVHGAINPATVFVHGSRGALLGLEAVQRAGPASSGGALEETNDPEYTAPERFEGSAADVRSDMYSLGCVLFAMLTGGPPFAHPDALQVRLLHLKAPIPRASGAGGEWDRLLTALLAKDLAARPRPADVVAALGRIARTERERARVAAPARSAAIPTLVLGAVLVGGALAAYTLTRSAVAPASSAGPEPSPTPSVTLAARATATGVIGATPTLAPTPVPSSAAPTAPPATPISTPSPALPPTAVPAPAVAAPAPPIVTPPPQTAAPAATPAPNVKAIPTTVLRGALAVFQLANFPPGVDMVLDLTGPDGKTTTPSIWTIAANGTALATMQTKTTDTPGTYVVAFRNGGLVVQVVIQIV